jgi:Lrp/AsnC family transcriptional regulator, leucine-responsive regulatory protein
MDIDRTDIRILEQLQRNAKLSHSALGELVHLSASQISRRVARLEDGGLLKGYTAVLDPVMLGLDVEAFTSVSLDRHDPGVGEAFEEGIQALDEILDCMAVTGEADYILRIVVPDLNAFARFVTDRLIKLPGVKMVRSNIGLHRIKRSHAMPLKYLAAPGNQRPKLRFHESSFENS